MYHSIEHNGKYWQCGLWVNQLKDATKYDTEEQADAAMAMRQINGRVVPNNTEWRDLTARTEQSHGIL